MSAATLARKLFKAVLPDPAAAQWQSKVAVIRALTEHITSLGRVHYDLEDVADAVDALLDRSVGAEEYVIRTAAEGERVDPYIDLSKIDFEGLAERFGNNKRAETERLAALLEVRAEAAASVNPTRVEFVERIEALISDYNAGSLNIDEYLRRLIELSGDLSVEEQRAVVEGMTEEELAIFDLLTQPEPELNDEELAEVRASAKRLLEHLHDKLVLDWRRKAAASAGVKTTIKDVLDADLPVDPYPPELFDTKVAAIYDHVLTMPTERTG